MPKSAFQAIFQMKSQEFTSSKPPIYQLTDMQSLPFLYPSKTLCTQPENLESIFHNLPFSSFTVRTYYYTQTHIQGLFNPYKKLYIYYIYIYIYIYICHYICVIIPELTCVIWWLSGKILSLTKLGGFRSQLETPCMSSHTEELWYNKTVCGWDIYIYI